MPTRRWRRPRSRPHPSGRSRLVATGAAGLLLAGAVATLPGGRAVATAGAPAGSLQVGSQLLSRCGGTPVAWCGSLRVPLDPADAAGPRITVAYRWYPATGPGAPAGTVVPVEGGPGYPSIGSVAPGGYAAMFGPLLAHWNMLAVDLRGTGASTVVDCPAVQDFSGSTGSARFRAVVAGCADSLNHRWTDARGRWVHASDLFTSAPAAEDLAAVIRALDLGKVDLYGDSYGSFFAQVFAARYPGLLRSLTLDSTYAVAHLDPWYRSTIEDMPADFDAVCARSPACAGAAPGPAWASIEALAARLRSAPISGTVPGPAGTPVAVTMDVVGLVDLVSDSAEDLQIYRGLDAAARALLDGGDPAPLLRLYAQRLAVDEAYFGVPATGYSGGLYFAASCLDYPQLFGMAGSPGTRGVQLATREASLPADTFAPFTTSEWLQMDENTEAYTACLSWPSPVVAQPPVTGSPPPLPASLPVLILGGELDTWTPPSGVAQVQHEIGGHSRVVIMANSTHVVAEGDPNHCASVLLREFVAQPQSLDALDASCASAVPPVHAVGVYPASLAGTPPLQRSGGSTAGTEALRLAAAAVATAGDAVARQSALGLAVDHGLHGGTVTASHSGAALQLSADQMVSGVRVSGTVEVTVTTATATLVATAPGVAPGSFRASWPLRGHGAQADVSGTVGSQAVTGTMPAP